MNAVMTDLSWLKDFQKQQMDLFIARGLPGRKEENWKYTPIAEKLAAFFPLALNETDQLSAAQTTIEKSVVTANLGKNLFQLSTPERIRLVFIDGQYCESLSDVEHLPSSIKLLSLQDAIENDEAYLKTNILNEFDVNKYPFAVLNNAFLGNGIYLHVPKNTSLSIPIHIVHIVKQHGVVHPRNIITVEESATVEVIEEFISNGTKHYTNAVTEIKAGSNSHVTYYKIQDENIHTIHTNNIFVNQKQDSRVALFNFTKGALLSREDVTISQAERNAECALYGLYALVHDEQHTDHHLYVDHLSEHGNSTMLYKGILNKKSRAVFNGKVLVQPNAQHIVAYQANHNILMSAESEVNTKPELEIYADNVKCTHGATVGQLDNESLFYFRSRGINKVDAMKLLVRAFADEVISKIPNKSIRQYVETRMGNYVEL